MELLVLQVIPLDVGHNELLTKTNSKEREAHITLVHTKSSILLIARPPIWATGPNGQNGPIVLNSVLTGNQKVFEPKHDLA